MESSSRNNPCPVCSRAKDADCRFSNDLILCHQGSSYAPPTHLKIGDVISIAGKDWALIKTNAGFDGAASLFRPHRHLRHRPKKRYSPFHRAQEEIDAQALIKAQKRVIEEFIILAQSALDVLEFETALPDELKVSFALIEKAYRQGKEIKAVFLYDPELKDWIDLVNETNKRLSYQYNDSLSFRQNQLGEIL